jgi:acyl transferase domain-containing protein
LQTLYVEAHGTGTQTGDPLEISAISAAFETAGRNERPLLVGSIKSNIGHTEAASGLASVIKVALSLERGYVPPNGNFQLANAKLELDRRNITIPKSAQPLVPTGGIRRASVNNFGFGGANAHAILESHDRAASMRSRPSNGTNGNGHVEDMRRGNRLYIFSAKDRESCQRMASNVADHLLQQDDVVDEEGFLDRLAYTLGSRRSRFPWSIVVSAGNLEELQQALNSGMHVAKRRHHDGMVRIGWVFTGQGAQWHAMGRELIDVYPVFQNALLECDQYIKEMGSGWTIMGMLLSTPTPLNISAN